jgi:hypothetical protein
MTEPTPEVLAQRQLNLDAGKNLNLPFDPIRTIENALQGVEFEMASQVRRYGEHSLGFHYIDMLRLQAWISEQSQLAKEAGDVSR